MKIESKFVGGIVSRIIRKVMRKKLDCDVDIQVNSFHATVTEEKAHVHLDADLDLPKEEFSKLIKKFGI